MPQSYSLGAGYGSIDYGSDRGKPDAVPDSTDGGSVAGNASDGVLVVRGVVKEYAAAAELLPSEEGDFIVRKATRQPGDSTVAVARFDAQGNLFLAGSVHQYPWADSGWYQFPYYVDGCFTLRTAADVPYAIITSEGSLFLRGGLFEMGRPDPGASPERLVFFEDFEDPASLSARGWTLSGDWTHTRYEQYSAVMTAAGWLAEPPDGGCTSMTCNDHMVSQDDSQTQHNSVAYGQIIVDTVRPVAECNGTGAQRCAEFIVGTLNALQLHSSTLPRFTARTQPAFCTPPSTPQNECSACLEISPDGVSMRDFRTESPVGANQPSWQEAGCVRWRFDALTAYDNHLLGGWANGIRVTQHGTPEKITPNHFLTLNATPSGGEYAERDLSIDENGNPVDWSDNDGFIISVHYQITRDGTASNPAALAIKLYEAGNESQVIRLAVEHYVQGTSAISRLLPSVDWNRDPATSISGETPAFPLDLFDRTVGALEDFSPRLRREIIWYELLVVAQKASADGTFRVLTLLKVEGNQVIPISWESVTSNPLYNSLPFALNSIRLELLNSYPTNGNVRIDDVTVTKLIAN